MNANPVLLPVLKEALEATFRHLPEILRREIQAPWLENPSEIPVWKSYPKIGSDQYRAVLMPAKKPFKPRNFWSVEHCMYEIAIGSICGVDGIQVQMLFGGHRKICGKGGYVESVHDIFRVAQARCPEIRFKGNETEGNSSLVRVLPAPLDPEAAGRDMAWIVDQTFLRIRELSDCS